jgi:RNA polymerase sigma-70 factor (ECF subfamily)
MTDIQALIDRWRHGDERAAEALYNHHRELIFRLAYGLLGDTADAEEVAQDTLTYALVNISRYDRERAGFSTWLHTITVSRCRDRRRRKFLPRLSLATWLTWGTDVPDPGPNPEQITAEDEINSQVWQAVQQLKQPLREAILLRYWAGHTYREIAEILDCPIATAQSRVRLAYEQLRAVLAPAVLTSVEREQVK